MGLSDSSSTTCLNRALKLFTSRKKLRRLSAPDLRSPAAQAGAAIKKMLINEKINILKRQDARNARVWKLKKWLFLALLASWRSISYLKQVPFITRPAAVEAQSPRGCHWVAAVRRRRRVPSLRS